MHNKISLALLLVLLTVGAIIASLYRSSPTNVATRASLLVVESVLATFALYALFFCVAYPLGRLDKYLTSRHRSDDSPFAGDRLPLHGWNPIAIAVKLYGNVVATQKLRCEEETFVMRVLGRFCAIARIAKAH